jgi:hypothetical protein
MATVSMLVKSASLIGRQGSSAFRLSTNSSVDVAHGLALLFSNRPSGVKRFQAIHQLQCRCRFSNRPSGVKRFQAIHQLQCRCRSRARASLRTRRQGPSIMGFEDEVEQSFGRPCRQCDGRSKRTYELTSSIVPRGTSFHRWVELDLLLSHLILHSSQATATSLVHRNSVPSTHMRCMITASRRASATIAFFIPRCLAIFIAQALSQDHFAERTNMLWAAS